MAAAIWLQSMRKSRKVEQEKRGKGESESLAVGTRFWKDVKEEWKEVLPLWRS